MMKIIYDFGSNNGDDIPYYTLKSDLVVAVEANPLLCQQISDRFKQFISSGKLIIENCIVSNQIYSDTAKFFVNKRDHVLSQFDEPRDGERDEFEVIYVSAKPASSLISRYGDPFYIKIDVERYDEEILRDLFASGIRPPYISAECHDINVFTTLVSIGRYRAFKLVEGSTVDKVYKSIVVSALDGTKRAVSFPRHSAGPFGQDIRGSWMTEGNFFRRLAFEGPGWKDVHASSVDNADESAKVRLGSYVMTAARRRLLNYLNLK